MQVTKLNREREVERVQRLLLRLHSPRLQMSLIVALTAAAGFLSSVAMLHAGVVEMWMRYPLAVACAYAVFLFLLWCWLRLRKEDWGDGGDVSGSPSRRGTEECAPPEKPASIDKGEFLDLGGLDGGDELVFVVIVLAVLAAAVWAVGWIIWIAPGLFAEILVDAALARGLYRRLPGFEEQHWLRSAVRRTGWLFLLAALLLGIAGAVMQYFAPTAKSIGQVFR